MDAAAPAVIAAEEEVTVRGSRREPGETSLAHEEVRSVPGAFGDAFRAIEALPGATPFQSGTPYAVLRGAPPGNSAVLIDGIPVPLLFHLAIGPAVISPQLVERVDYFAGGAPASFGRAIGGVISAQTRDPSPTRRGHAQVRLFDAGALVESPFADGRAHALASGRYSYTAAALSLFSPGVDLAYWDYQARASVDVTDRDHLSVFAFGSHDQRGPIAHLLTRFNADFHRVDLRYDRDLRGGKVRIAATLGDDRSGNEQGSTHGRSIRVRASFEHSVGATAQWRAGADSSFTRVERGVATDPSLAVPLALIYPQHDDLATGVWSDLVLRPTRRLEIVPGARVDLYDWRVRTSTALPREVRVDPPTTSEVAFDPRLAMRLTVRPGLALFTTLGRYHAGPSFFVPVPGLQPSGFHSGLQASTQHSAGVEVGLPADLVATGSVFRHDYENATSFTSCSIPSGGFDLTSPCIRTRKEGTAMGLELFVRRPLTKRIGGWVAYTLSRTVDAEIGSPFSARPTPFDHTHVLNVVGNVSLGRGYSAGARLFFYSGRPAAAGGRTDDFARLDVRLEKRWTLPGTAWIALVLEGLNVTFAEEDSSNLCAPTSTTNPSCASGSGAAVVVPSIGVEAASM